MQPKTLRELRASPYGKERYRSRSVKDEMRRNLMEKS